MLRIALAQALDELCSLPANARRLVTSIARAAELDSIVEVQGRTIEHLCARIFHLERELADTRKLVGAQLAAVAYAKKLDEREAIAIVKKLADQESR